jgi:sugar lactone lactonase YvrE
MGAILRWLPVTCAPDGRLIGLDMESVYVINADGSLTVLATRFLGAEDVVADASGAMYVADGLAASVTRVDSDGTVTKLADVLPDNCHLAFDAQEQLYVTNAGPQYPFARIDTTTGQVTRAYPSEETHCSMMSPADFVFYDDTQVVFAPWAAGKMALFDMAAGTGDYLIDVPFDNTGTSVLGPDERITLATRSCTSNGPVTDIVRFNADGTTKRWLRNLPGNVMDIDFAPDGTFFFTYTSERESGLYYVEAGEQGMVRVLGTEGQEYPAMAVNPQNGHAYCSIFQPSDERIVLQEYSRQGLVATYDVTLPAACSGPLLRFDPQGRLFAATAEMERLLTGPVVQRWILLLDLEEETSTIYAQSDLPHCCPLYNFSIDADGNIWWINNPDFQLFRINPQGEMKLFACFTPIDASQALRNKDEDLFIIHPGGIMRISPVK